MVWGTGIRLCSFERFVTAIVVLIALPTCLGFAQTSTATILGVVKDTTGALIPGVSITVKHTDTGQTRTAISSETGDYIVALLPVGEYEITTTMPSFKKEVRRGINLVVGQQAVIDLTVEVGAPEETVVVTEEAPLVNTTLSSTSGLITEQQVKELPLNGRSFDQLLALNVGVVNNTSNMGGGAYPGFSVAGHRTEANRFLINGVDWVGGNAASVFITPGGASGQLLGVEAVREYNVLELTYGAEYGKRSGGQVSIVTSSGTNEWHGNLFEYHRNSALDTRDFFQTEKGPFKRHQFGGSIGGPLKKDKLFVFGNYEGFRQRLGQSNRAIYPDVQSRQGLLPCYLAYPTNVAANCPDRAAFVLVPNLKPGMLPFAKDVPNQFNLVRNPLPVGFRSTESAWYFQDEMKLRSNLTLRLGLRHEMTNGWNEVTGRCTNYVFDKNFLISTEPVSGPSCLDENHAKLLLQPRVGIAWDPTGRGTWAVRAGFGIHNDLQDILGNRAYSNPPFSAREQPSGPLLSMIPLQKNAP